MNGLTIYSDEELLKIQQLELEALQEVLRICRENDIEYFLIDGAAIGALRHGGFIPWDDDLDIGMTRENYRRFLACAPGCISDRYYIQSPYDSKKNPYFYTKIRINNTRFVEYCNRKLDIHHGVYIDICPFDEVPDDEALNLKQFRICQLLIRLFVIRQSPELSRPPVGVKKKIIALIRLILHRLFRLIPYRCFAAAIEAETTKYNGTGQKAYAFLHYPKRKVDYILKSELYALRQHPFAYLTVNIPHDCEAYLRRHYGDYLTYPPPEERYGHKPYEFEIQ